MHRVLSISIALAVSVTAGMPRPAAAAAVPAELSRLVPADPLVTLYMPSVDGLQRDVRDLVRVFAPESADEVRVFDWIPGDLGDVEAIMDPTRPAVAVLRLAQGMPAPLFTTIVPLRDRSATADSIEDLLGARPLAVQDGYAVLGTDPTYQPGGASPQLFEGMGGDDATLRIDLEGFFLAMGPMLDMFVQMALTQPDATTGEAAMTPEAMVSVMETIGLLRDGLATLEVAVDVDGDRVRLAGGVEFHEDGPLALLAQGSLDDAWEQAGWLDPDAAFLVVSALDLSNLRPLLEPVLDLVGGFAATEPDLDPFLALTELQKASPRLMEMGLRPYVASYGLGDAGVEMRWIARDPDAAELQTQFVAATRVWSAFGLRSEWSDARQVAGFTLRSAALDFDVDGLPPAVIDTLSTEQRVQMEQMIEAWLAPMHVAAGRDRSVILLDHDTASVDDLLGRMAKGDAGPVAPMLEQARAWAGDDALSVGALDFGRTMAMVATMFPWDEDDPEAERNRELLAAAPSAPVFGASWVDRQWLRGRIEMRTDAASALWGFFEALDASTGDDEPGY